MPGAVPQAGSRGAWKEPSSRCILSKILHMSLLKYFICILSCCSLNNVSEMKWVLELKCSFSES